MDNVALFYSTLLKVQNVEDPLNVVAEPGLCRSFIFFHLHRQMKSGYFYFHSMDTEMKASVQDLEDRKGPSQGENLDLLTHL